MGGDYWAFYVSGGQVERLNSVQTIGQTLPFGLRIARACRGLPALKGLKMNRITRKDIDGAINYLNRITGNDSEPYRKEGDKWLANKGNFHLSGAYGGHSLHQMGNDDGGIRDIFNCGHVPMRELYDLIHAYIKGIEFARKEVMA